MDHLLDGLTNVACNYRCPALLTGPNSGGGSLTRTGLSVHFPDKDLFTGKTQDSDVLRRIKTGISQTLQIFAEEIP